MMRTGFTGYVDGFGACAHAAPAAIARITVVIRRIAFATITSSSEIKAGIDFVKEGQPPVFRAARSAAALVQRPYSRQLFSILIRLHARRLHDRAPLLILGAYEPPELFGR